MNSGKRVGLVAAPCDGNSRCELHVTFKGKGKKMSKTAAFRFEWEGAGVSVLVGFLALLISVRAAGHYSEGRWSLL